jgi:hypothetical protein
MKNIKQGVIVCVFALTQLLLNPSAIASDEDYGNNNEEQFSEAELAQILAPIALYPDSLLTHIVIAATYPLEVVEAHRWRERNSNLDASEAVERAEEKGWDPSIAALVAFPSVLERLNEDLQWTQNLGEAFLEDEGRVLDTIQTLREQADRANSFDNMQNMRVTKVNKVIVIEPVQKEIVYVPYYDTRVVYGDWYWNRYPPVYWHHRPYLSVHLPGRISGLFHWNTGINISFNYHFSAFNWRSRHLVVTHHHKTRKYRSHSRIASSHGAKRWQHKPTHRRGVAYRSSKLTRDFDRSNKRLGNERRTLRQHNKETKFTRKQNKRSIHSNFKDKLARNNKAVARRYTANEGTKTTKQERQTHQERGRSHLKESSQLRENSQLKENHRPKESRQPANNQAQVNSRSEAKSQHQKPQRHKVRKPKQNSQAKRNKRER